MGAPSQSEPGVERCDAEALADDTESIERVRDRCGRELAQSLHDGVIAHPDCFPNMDS
jgi:hypothetical protein